MNFITFYNLHQFGTGVVRSNERHVISML